jgi:GTPase SAR1 family protein
MEIFLQSPSPKAVLLIGKQGSGKSSLIHQLQAYFEDSHRFMWMQNSAALEQQMANFITAQSIDAMFSKSTMRKKVLVLDDIDTWVSIPNFVLEAIKAPKVHIILTVERIRKLPKLAKLVSEVVHMNISSKEDSEYLDLCKRLVKYDFNTIRHVISNDGISISNTIYESLTDAQIPLRCWIANMSSFLTWSNYNFEPVVLEIYLLCVVYMTVLVGKVNIRMVSAIPSRYANASFMGGGGGVLD